MLPSHILDWDQLESHAADFCHWTGEAANREINWFQRAWGHVVKTGLAEYSTELERCQVAIRFLTLGVVYADFLHLLLEDNCEPWFRDTAEALEIRPFHLALLLDHEQKEAVADPTDEGESYDRALDELTDTNRSPIHKLLNDAFPEGQLCLDMFAIGLQEQSLGNEGEMDLENLAHKHPEAFAFVELDQFHCERWY